MLAAAVEADLVEHVARLHGPPIGEVRREAGSVWFLTGKDDPNENGVLRAALGNGPVEESVRSLTEPFAGRGLPMMWWIFTRDTPPARVDVALRDQGLALRSDRPGMGLVQHPAGLFVAPVIHTLALAAGQHLQRAAHDVARDRRGLPSRGQRVAAEEGDVERQARGDGPGVLAAVEVEQAQRRQVPLALLQRAHHHRRQGVALRAVEAGGLA